MTLYCQIPYNKGELTVTFEAYPKMVDDSYSDEFGLVKIKPYVSLKESDDLTWEKEGLSEIENKAIKDWLEKEKYKNQKLIEKIFCDKYANQLNDF